MYKSQEVFSKYEKKRQRNIDTMKTVLNSAMNTVS